MSSDAVRLSPVAGARPALVAGVTALVPAAVINLGVLAAARATDHAPVLKPQGGVTTEVVAVNVLLMTALALAVGTVVLAVVRARGAGFPTAAVGLVIGVGTAVMPLSMGGDLGGRLALAAMHLVTGVSWFVAVRRSR